MTREETGESVAGPMQESLTQHASLQPRLAWILYYHKTGSIQDVCMKFGISRKTLYKWLKRYRKGHGDSLCLADQSRRPHHSPKATPPEHIAIIQRARTETGYGQRRLRLYLQQKYNINISERTIWKILKRLTTSSSDGTVVTHAGITNPLSQ